MAATNTDGPVFIYGAMGYISSGLGGATGIVPEYNLDAGPSITYQGDSIPDVRYFYQKDQVQGYQGKIPSFQNVPYVESVDRIPAANGVATIAAAAFVTSGTAMTLVTTNSVSVSCNLSIIPQSSIINSGTPVVVPIALDYGFQGATTTLSSQTVTVGDSTQFVIGMPVVIPGAGNSGGTAPLYTWVTGIPTATTITVNDVAASAQTAVMIGTGNLWYPSGSIGGITSQLYPTAVLPYQAAGPGLFLDPAQSIARGTSVTAAASATGGVFIIRGYDIYGQPMAEQITAVAASTVYGKKAFKYIASVTPQFTDGSHTYSVGTSDVFGMHNRSDRWEYSNVFWAAAFMTATAGWLAGVTGTQTATTGDVRGTIQTSAIGGGTGIGTTQSNGTLSSLLMTGNRLAIFQSQPLFNTIRATPFNTAPQSGATQFTQ